MTPELLTVSLRLPIAVQFLNLTLSSSFGNGTRIPDGEYRVLLSALKIFGNRNNPGDWITHRSPNFIKASTASNETATPP